MIIKSIFELAAIIFLIVGFFNEKKLIQLEDACCARFKSWRSGKKVTK